MNFFLYSPATCQQSRVVQIICRTEIKSLHLVLPCFTMRHKWHAKKLLLVKNCIGRAMGRLFQPLKCCCFERETNIIFRVFSDMNNFEWEINLYNIYNFIASGIITFSIAHVIQNEWSKRQKKKTWHKMFFYAI